LHNIAPMIKQFLLPFLPFFTITLTAQNISDTAMSVEKMDSIFRVEAEEIDGEDGTWQLFYGNRIVFVLSDEVHNRMRIFTPIGAEEDLEAGQEKAMLEANFHSALDAKYCLYNGFIVSVYTHPLKELTPDQLKEALAQVVILANNFGGSYSSTDLLFGLGESQEEVPLPSEKDSDKRVNQKPTKKN